jgi:hypothetical protein
MSPWFSICLSVRYNVPGLIASSQKLAIFSIVRSRRSSTAVVTSGPAASASFSDEPVECADTAQAYCFQLSDVLERGKEEGMLLPLLRTIT